MARGEFAEAVSWSDRAARSPGAHVLIAMIAAVAQLMAGDEVRARTWADNVRERNAKLTSKDFFTAFPLKDPATQGSVAAALATLGF
jgi:hypothetical protein